MHLFVAEMPEKGVSLHVIVAQGTIARLTPDSFDDTKLCLLWRGGQRKALSFSHLTSYHWTCPTSAAVYRFKLAPNPGGGPLNF